MAWSTLLPELGIIALVALLAVGAHLLLQRRLPFEMLRKHNDVAGFLFSAIGTIFAVVLGFLVIVVWEKYDAAVDTTQREVAAVSDLYRTVVSYPAPLRLAIRRDLHGYVDVVSGVEWPAMAAGGKATAGIPILERIAYRVDGFQPKTLAEQDAQDKSMDQVQRLLDARRLRGHENEPSVPAILWFALSAGALAMLAFAFLFGVENRVSQLVMTAILASVIGLLFMVIYEFDSPFSGAVGVPSESWTALHARLQLIR